MCNIDNFLFHRNGLINAFLIGHSYQKISTYSTANKRRLQIFRKNSMRLIKGKKYSIRSITYQLPQIFRKVEPDYLKSKPGSLVNVAAQL